MGHWIGNMAGLTYEFFRGEMKHDANPTSGIGQTISFFFLSPPHLSFALLAISSRFLAFLVHFRWGVS